MSERRERFLIHLANRLNRPRKKSKAAQPEWKKNPQWNVFKNATTKELIDVLEAQCRIIHTACKRTNKERLPNVLYETIIEYGNGPIVTAKDDRNAIYGLTALYEKMALDNIDIMEWDETQGIDNVAFAERANIGISFSDITLAESGTITIFNDKYNSRTISLLPIHFIAIIPKETIVPRLSHATRKIHELQTNGTDIPSCISFISGPSNSADIELNLVVGVHGPVQATYIVVE